MRIPPLRLLPIFLAVVLLAGFAVPARAADCDFDQNGTANYYDYYAFIDVWTSLSSVDQNHDGVVSVGDYFLYLGLWFAGDPAADFNADGNVTDDDVQAYLAAYLRIVNGPTTDFDGDGRTVLDTDDIFAFVGQCL